MQKILFLSVRHRRTYCVSNSFLYRTLVICCEPCSSSPATSRVDPPISRASIDAAIEIPRSNISKPRDIDRQQESSGIANQAQSLLRAGNEMECESAQDAVPNCPDPRLDCLRAIYKAHKNPQPILNLLGTVLPNELKLHVMNALVEQYYPTVHLQDKHDLDVIILETLKFCRDENINYDLVEILKEAILKTLTVGVDIKFEEQRPKLWLVNPIIEQSLMELCGKIRHLEWYAAPELRNRDRVRFHVLHRAIQGMRQLKERFPRLLSFTAVLDIQMQWF